MKLTGYEISRMIDLSAVKAEDDDTYIRSLVECAREYRCIAVIPLPSRTLLVKELLQGDPDITLGGAIGFPSGGHTTSIKVAEAKELIALGCSELDMVMNIGKMVSGRTTEVLEDICAVIEAADGVPVKVILECHYLTHDQIRKGCDLCVQAGASFVKTGTGWAPTGATLENIALIKAQVGEAIGVKAAGGVRDLETLLQMYRMGARRFGIALHSATKILEQIQSLPDGVAEVSPLTVKGLQKTN